jgi:hypothetical protein
MLAYFLVFGQTVCWSSPRVKGIMKMSKITDKHFVAMMGSLYLSEKITQISGKQAADELPPMEAMVLGLMCINNKYNSASLYKYLTRTTMFDLRECGLIVEIGMLNLIKAGYLKPGNVQAKKALESRDTTVWGLGDIPFVVTAKGAKRISYLVGTARSVEAKQVASDVQTESKAAAAH